MNLNLGNYENVKTYADEEFNLDTLCKEGTTFDLRVMEKESDEQNNVRAPHCEDMVNDYRESKNSSANDDSDDDILSQSDNDKDINDSVCEIDSFEDIASSSVPLTDDRGVLKEILTSGMGGVVGPKASIIVNYSAYLEYADTPFDSTQLRNKSLICDIGSQSMIEGLEIGLATMKKNEKARFLIRPDYAFGSFGCPPRIPANATCLYVVTLLSFTRFEESASGYFSLPVSQRNKVPFSVLMHALQTVLGQARSHYQNKDFVMARKSYDQALMMLEHYRLKNNDEEVRMKKMLMKVLIDIALSSLKINQPHRTLHYCSRLLEMNCHHAKAHYLKAKALNQIGKFDKAEKSLLKADKIEPNCKEIVSELAAVRERLSKMQVCLHHKPSARHVHNHNDDIHKQDKNGKKEEE